MEAVVDLKAVLGGEAVLGCVRHAALTPVEISVYRNNRFHRPPMIPRDTPPAWWAGKRKDLSRVREVCARVWDDGVRVVLGWYEAVTADRRACCQ
ncbi:hypothetical protein GCM10010219_45670 [Streptomyces netropsis]|nr:hypothetical protein GCM10010219_45670 [Streptomyces netropsis]